MAFSQGNAEMEKTTRRKFERRPFKRVFAEQKSFLHIEFPANGGREREREREIQSDRERARRRGKNDSNTLKIFKAGRVDLFQVSVRFHPGPLEFASAGHPRQNACLDEGKGKQKGKNASIKK